MLLRTTRIFRNKGQHYIRSKFNKSNINHTYKYFIHLPLTQRIDRNKTSFRNNLTSMVKTRSNRDTNAVSSAWKNVKRTITSTTRKAINKRKVQKKTVARSKKKALIKSITTTTDIPRTPSKKKKKNNSLPTHAVSPGPTKKPPKDDWQEVYNILVELRKDRSAPVDWAALPEKGPHHAFQTLIALMLSSQTKDQMVSTVMKRLQKHGLTVENIAKTSDKKLFELIYGVGFHNKKVIYIRKTVQQIIEKYDGTVPANLKDLISFPGVGPKMGIIIMNVAFNKHVGISVDTHVHRICQQLGWVKKVKKPEDTRRQMEAWLPKEEWGNINLLLVGVGQEVQQEQQKLLKKCLQLKPKRRKEKALKIIQKLGVNVKREIERLKVEGGEAKHK